MPIPTENVGSLPRPAKLQAAIKDYDAGKITQQQLTLEQDAACLDSIKRMEATGAPIVSDGEQRASKLRHLSPHGYFWRAQASPKTWLPMANTSHFTDGHHRQSASPTAALQVQDICRRLPREGNENGVETVEAGRDRALHAGLAVPPRRGSHGLHPRTIPQRLVQRVREGYPEVLRCGRRPCFPLTSPKEGSLARTILESLDRLAACSSISSSSTTASIDRFSPATQKHRHSHLSRRRLRLDHSAEVDYAELLPSLFKMNAGYFLIQLRERERQGACLQTLRAVQ